MKKLLSAAAVLASVALPVFAEEPKEEWQGYFSCEVFANNAVIYWPNGIPDVNGSLKFTNDPTGWGDDLRGQRIHVAITIIGDYHKNIYISREFASQDATKWGRDDNPTLIDNWREFQGEGLRALIKLNHNKGVYAIDVDSVIVGHVSVTHSGTTARITTVNDEVYHVWNGNGIHVTEDYWLNKCTEMWTPKTK